MISGEHVCYLGRTYHNLAAPGDMAAGVDESSTERGRNDCPEPFHPYFGF